MSRLDLVVGPNGAGKSTFVEFVLADARPAVPFVNADVIAAERWPEDPLSHAYEAAQAAETARDALLARGESFIAETVASHESEVDLVRRARDAGYYVHLVVVAVPEEYSVERVLARVAVGGHDVPEEKIRSRWRRLWDNVVATTGSSARSLPDPNQRYDHGAHTVSSTRPTSAGKTLLTQRGFDRGHRKRCLTRHYLAARSGSARWARTAPAKGPGASIIG